MYACGGWGACLPLVVFGLIVAACARVLVGWRGDVGGYVLCFLGGYAI